MLPHVFSTRSKIIQQQVVVADVISDRNIPLIEPIIFLKIEIALFH